MASSDEKMEKKIQDKGLNAPRLTSQTPQTPQTPQDIDDAIVKADYYIF